jgi:beta-glucuronidase
MLALRDTATRERKSLDGLWRFTLDAAGAGREGWQYGLPAGARGIPVPASYNDVFPEPEIRDQRPGPRSTRPSCWRCRTGSSTGWTR